MRMMLMVRGRLVCCVGLITSNEYPPLARLGYKELRKRWKYSDGGIPFTALNTEENLLVLEKPAFSANTENFTESKSGSRSTQSIKYSMRACWI